MQQPDEIREWLQNWTGGSALAESLATAVLLHEGFSGMPPFRSLSGSNDEYYPAFAKDGRLWLMTIYFPNGPVQFVSTRRKLAVDLAYAEKIGARGLVFVTNQSCARVQDIPGLGARNIIHCSIDLEHLTAFLKKPEMANVKQQFLSAPPVSINGVPVTIAPPQPPSKLRKQISTVSHIIKLTDFALVNFRCFANLYVELSPDLTIFVAENGQGKSTILQACQIALWPFVSSFDLAHAAARLPDGIGVDDIHLHAMPNGDLARDLPCQIAARGQVREWDDLEWQQERTSENPAEETQDGGDTAMLRSWARLLQHEIREDQTPPLTLPVFASYGTGRLAGQQQLKRNNSEPDSPDNSFYVRTFAYRDCLAPNASYEHFSTWFKWVFKSYRETQIKNREQGLPDDTPSPWQDTIFVVQQAVDCLLRDITGWHSLEYSISHGEALILRNDQKMVMKLGQLSDGVRGMLALVGDLAYRCIKLNPHLGREAARQASGVVLIDEVDMHLHPKWQQRVVGQLRQAFPAIQFILTTHSPQVLSTVQRENIRVIQIDERGMATAEPPLAMTYGEPSGDVMQAVMEVDPQPPVAEKADLDKLTELVDSGHYQDEEATALMAHLNQRLGAQHPQLQRLQRSIRRQKALRA